MTPGFVLALSGGSGAVYALRLLETFLAGGHSVHLSVSPAGQAVLATELGLKIDLAPERFDADALLAGCQWLYRTGQARPPLAQRAATPGRIFYHAPQDFLAPIASGSFLTRGMVICPCSGATASAIAHGASNNLIQRAADVHLKERRPLLLVPRETPVSAIQLENLMRCAQAGAVVLPAMPGWYHGVATLADLVDFIVARICDQLQVPHNLARRWGDSA